jgi:hypothetical protein
MAPRTTLDVGGAVPLAGRTRLTAELAVGVVTGTLDVVLEASATGTEGTYRTLVTLSAVAPGVVSKASPADFQLLAHDRVVRARVATITDATFELRLLAPWVTVTADAALFSKELRGFADGFARLVGEAEDTVMAELMPRQRPAVPLYPRTATPMVRALLPEVVDTYTAEQAERIAGQPLPLLLDANITLPGFGDAIRIAIVRQAEHLFRRHKLTQRDDPAALVTLRTLSDKAPGLMSGLARFRSESLVVWRGR